MPEKSPAGIAPSPLRLTEWIVRHRYLWFAVIGLLLLVSFNGHWQIGPDSAAYRALGHNLATSGRYFFREKVVGLEDYANQQATRYPGLPILLAALEKIFGVSDLPPLLMMQGFTVILLVLTYRLMLYRVEPWVAVSVVFGMGTNARFLQYSNEILTDIPFLLGLVLAMLGYEQLLRAKGLKQVCKSGGVLLAGMIFAASMRPTFYFFAAALVITCVWKLRRQIIHGFRFLLRRVWPGRVLVAVSEKLWWSAAARFSRFKRFRPAKISKQFDVPGEPWKFGLILGVLFLTAAVFVVIVDLRSKHGVLGGGYEHHVFSRLDKMVRLSPGSIHEMLENALPTAFYATRIGPSFIPLYSGFRVGFGTIYSLLVIGSGIWLVRRNLLWGLLVLISVAAFALTGAVPRYFVMLLPLLLAGWGLMVRGVAQISWRSRAGRIRTLPPMLRELIVLVLISVAAFALTGAVPRYFVMLLPLLLAGWGLMVRGVAQISWRSRAGRIRTLPPMLRELIVLTGLGFVVGANLAVASDFILKQRGYTRPIENGKWRGFHYVGFLKVHHKGIWQHVYELRNMVRANTRPDQKLLGPEATVLTYLTDRQVYFPAIAETQRAMSRRGAESYFKLALIRVNDESPGFFEYDKVIHDLAEEQLIATGKTIAGPVGGYALMEFEVIPPHPRGGHRHSTTTTPAPTTAPAITPTPIAPSTTRPSHRSPKRAVQSPP